VIGTIIDVVVMMGRQWYDKSMEELGYLLGLRTVLYMHSSECTSTYEGTE